MAHKTLIAYASKSGATKETALELQKTLKKKHKFEVDLLNLRKEDPPDLTPYENVIIASGIRVGRWYKEALKFLKRKFSNKKVAVYLSSGTALDPEKADFVKTEYLDKVLAQYPHIKPITQTVFGWNVKIFGLKKEDCGDWGKIRAWADELAAKILE